KTIWWKCEKGDDHEWSVSSAHRINGRNCPICSGHKTVLSTSIATTHPKLLKQWHPTLNGTLKPSQFSLGSNKKVWWKCEKGDDHEWKAVVSSRNRSDCPFCTLTPQSKQELTITFELMKIFKNIDPKGLKTKLEGRLRAIDIFIPKLNLCIEFDGSYWHKDKRDVDKIKSEMLFEEGFKLIRVREEPLKKIYDTDVISKKPYNGKQVTNDILSMILSIFELDNKLVSNIKEYQSKDDLQNEKGLDKYIDKILTEKAEKK
ncbi:zinc-ribbon domain-containing protein, partial [Flavobacteriaceae bacterium]|nr:zinc-ribbon domain-containing protein [Flavobacteriaceae bacterium]